jgi:hypothetical protein
LRDAVTNAYRKSYAHCNGYCHRHSNSYSDGYSHCDSDSSN